MTQYNEIFQRLQTSAFRAHFHLSPTLRYYVIEKGLPTIQRHATDFIATRLAPANIPNDGRQTPMKNHPIFVAQHACACCCRGCLFKWYDIPKNRSLTKDEQRKIVDLLMAWIEREMDNNSQVEIN